MLGFITLFIFVVCGSNTCSDDIAKQEAIQIHLSEQAQLESRIRQLESDLLREQQRALTRFWHGTEDRVRESFLYFFDNSGIAEELEKILGMRFASDYFREILISAYYVLTHFDNGSVHLLFNYSVDHERNITWRIVGYDVPWLNDPMLMNYLVQPVTPSFTVIRQSATPRRLTDESYVTVRFYHFPDTAPYYRPHQYTEKTIAGENLWSEAIRISHEHGFLVRDLWYEDDTLYVDLKLAMNFAFRSGWGSTVWAMAMAYTFYSFPGVNDVIFLLDGGEMPLVYNHFSINNPRDFHFQ